MTIPFSASLGKTYIFLVAALVAGFVAVTSAPESLACNGGGGGSSSGSGDMLRNLRSRMLNQNRARRPRRAVRRTYWPTKRVRRRRRRTSAHVRRRPGVTKKNLWSTAGQPPVESVGPSMAPPIPETGGATPPSRPVITLPPPPPTWEERTIPSFVQGKPPSKNASPPNTRLNIPYPFPGGTPGIPGSTPGFDGPKHLDPIDPGDIADFIGHIGNSGLDKNIGRLGNVISAIKIAGRANDIRTAPNEAARKRAYDETKKEISSTAGGTLGGLLGNALGGPPGGALGSYIGSELGGKIHDASKNIQRRSGPEARGGYSLPSVK